MSTAIRLAMLCSVSAGLTVSTSIRRGLRLAASAVVSSLKDPNSSLKEASGTD